MMVIIVIIVMEFFSYETRQQQQKRCLDGANEKGNKSILIGIDNDDDY